MSTPDQREQPTPDEASAATAPAVPKADDLDALAAQLSGTLVTDPDAGYSTTRQPTTPKSSSRALMAQAKAVFVGGVTWNDTVTVRASTSSKPVSSYPTSSAEFETVNHESATTAATVGSVIAMRGAVSPAAVGVDIGCGVAAVRTDLVEDALMIALTEIPR